jgi:hypothetical protein
LLDDFKSKGETNMKTMKLFRVTFESLSLKNGMTAMVAAAKPSKSKAALLRLWTPLGLLMFNPH